VELVDFQVGTERLEDGTFVVSVAGELDLYTAPELERALLGADGAGSVVVDLSQCTFIDSSSLSTLITAKRRLDLAEAQLSVVTTSSEITRPFELTGLDREFAFHPSVTSARNGATR